MRPSAHRITPSATPAWSAGQPAPAGRDQPGPRAFFLDEMPEFNRKTLRSSAGRSRRARSSSAGPFTTLHFRPTYPGRRHESLPLRIPVRSPPGLLLHAAPGGEVPQQDLRAPARPHRPARRGPRRPLHPAGRDAPRSASADFGAEVLEDGRPGQAVRARRPRSTAG